MNNLIKEFNKNQNDLLAKKEKFPIPELSKSEVNLMDELVKNITDILLKDWENEVCLIALNELNTSVYIKCRIYAQLNKIKAPPRKFISVYQDYNNPVVFIHHLQWRFSSLIESVFNEKTENLNYSEKLNFAENCYQEADSFKLLGFSLASADFGELEEQFFDSLRKIKEELEEKILIEKKELNDRLELQNLADKSPDVEQNNKNLSKQKGFTLRQKVIVLMITHFGTLDRPEDVKQERIVEHIHNIIGGDVTKIRNLVRNPTAHRGDPQSIKYLCDDLNLVRNQLGKLGKKQTVIDFVSEIDFLLGELEKN